MRTFLSVDLDYWNEDFNSGGEKSLIRMKKYLKSIYNSGVPVVLVENHDEMLPFVDKSKADFLVNIDYHSDLADLRIEPGESAILGERDFNCGTWVNWVDRRASSNFLWIHPNRHCYIDSCNSYFGKRGGGRCDTQRNPFTAEFDTGWKSVKHKTSAPPKLESMEDIVMIGICISPDYINFPEDLAYDLLAGSGFNNPWRCEEASVVYNGKRSRSWSKRL